MAKLANCKACDKEIAKGIKKCPHCGKDQRNFFMKHKVITAALILVVIGGAAAAGSGGNGSETEDSSKTSSTSVEKDEKTKVTYDNYLKIKMEDNYDNVVALIGEGKESSSSELSGIKTVMYTWNGAGISNMDVTIQNGVVTGKAQAGLKDADDKVTLDKYNQVKEGMTYDQVKGILGEGQITSQTKIMNIESILYSWINKDGSNMNGTFTDNKLQMKAQFDLK